MTRYLSVSLSDGTAAAGILDEDGGIRVLARGVPGDHSPMRRLLMAGELASTEPESDVIPLSQVTVLPPVPDPGKIVAAPVNYTDHQTEMSEVVHIGSLGVFLKAPTSLIADGGVVRLPYHDRRFDQEGELAVVIGRRASHVDEANALEHVVGYTCLLDMTMRGGEDRSTRKSFDTFTPMGPLLVTPDEVGPLDQLRLITRVNGDRRQDADIADLIWDVPKLISYVSSVMVLEPGDVIATGTPAGVGQIHDGDEISVEVGRVGTLTVLVSAQDAVACPTSGARRGPLPPSELTPVRNSSEAS
ncbi:fumarylacetoacetate hydrolase family protein [Nocardioides sp. 1609]|uniref:fumarylacetoacetate hydrolase family protein n=1 Tax=Nocardioides sp. 1609 TaxID=2508327 RepID=UPI00106F6779|nr:fumarylacetoacetate hydrolase family protein [Nocardioides sp. 1609]